MKYDSSVVDISRISLIDSPKSTLSNINLRYVLRIPFKNINKGLTTTIVMMNPSKANRVEPDPSVDKLIEFLSTFSMNGHLRKNAGLERKFVKSFFWNEQIQGLY